MLFAFSKCKNDTIFSMTDSMNFGPDWIRNLSSEGTTGGGTSGGTRCQLADFRYGREEMLALYDRNIKPPACLANFKCLYSESTLPPLALLPTTDEERGGWQSRPTTLSGPPRGRGGSLERGGRVNRGRGGYQSYTRPSTNYDGSWGNGEPSDWSPRKEYNSRPASMDNWRRARNNEEDDGWRLSSGRGMHDKWGRSTSWRGESEGEERSGPPERGGRAAWHDGVSRGQSLRRSWDNEDHLPEWANENPLESGGSFDDRGAFHGSDDEQPEGRVSSRKEGLQKSTSQQHISHKTHPPLLSSKSTISLVKDIATEKNKEKQELLNKNSEVPPKENHTPEKERKLSVPEMSEKSVKEVISIKERAKSEGPPKHIENQQSASQNENKVEDSDFERLQEDFVLKLVVDEEPPKQNQPHNNFDLSNLPPPPNLTVSGQEKWFYQDPQGQMQGPFTNMEMLEWFKAGYFGQDLKVRRQCDERFFLLGELMAMCGGSNPFQTSVRFPILKNDISKMPESDLLQFQYLSQLATYKQTQNRVIPDPWSALSLQQQELAAQRLIIHQQQAQQDLQYLQQPPATTPLMHMISQMQQANKLPTTGILDKQPPNMPGTIDPHLHMHMTNFLSLQNRLPAALPNHLPGNIPGNVSGPMPPENISTNLPNLQSTGMGTQGIPIPGIQGGLTTGLGINVPRPNSVEHNTGQDGDPITSLLKQLQQQKQHNQVESLWQQNQFGVANSGHPQQNWPGQVQETPLSMWDMQQSSSGATPPTQENHKQSSESSPQKQLDSTFSDKERPKKSEKNKENRQKEEEKEQKKRKKVEEDQQKKEAEEKRKQEQRKLEAEKKAEAERKRKEEERIKKEIEKAKKEAEEKRLRELEERRRLKEQRKLEEEAKKKAEEIKKLEDDKIQKEKEQREREEKLRAEERRQEQISLSKAAPWSQANSNLGMSLADIQKAEKEKKVQEAALQAQRAAQLEKEIKLQQQQFDKPGGLQLGWAKKPLEPRKVKSLAEIQAEEQERLAKEAAETRLRKEKEARETVQLHTTNTIWSGQSLTWANASSAHSQWSSTTNISGFWDEPAQKPQPNKPSTVSKSSSMSTLSTNSCKQIHQQKQQKTKTKKEELAPKKNNHNNNIDDEFTNWCYKALENISTNVDIPTFVTFLRDIESAFEVREYCKEYLGENNTTQQFANNFLEKRRSFKSKDCYKDDMCSPAPAITPSAQHSTEFQEVKGKNKKSKKSKMLKVDSRILGFNVTSAPDRINVGDRDYGDNS